MASNRQREFALRLQASFQEHGYERCQIEDQGDLATLQVLLPLYEEGRGLVIMDLCLVDYDEDFELVQIYSTMTPEPGPGLPALRQTLGEWNMVALAGAYGIYEELGQLYHKYNVVVRAQEDLDDVVADVLAGVFMATEEMSRRLVEAVRLSSGETDMEEIPEEE